MIKEIASTALSVIAGDSAAKDQKKAEKKRLEEARRVDAENYRRAREAVGAEGSALLPLYFTQSRYLPGELAAMNDKELNQAAMLAGVEAAELTDPLERQRVIREIEAKEGQSLERTMAGNVMDLYNQYDSPADRIRAFQQLRSNLAPAQAATSQYVNDLFSGQMLQDELAELQPVAQARLNQAAAFEDAANQRLASQLNRQQAQFARKGYTGAGSASDRLEASANRQIAQQTAGMRSDAVLKNALADLAARANARRRQGANLATPLNQLGTAANFSTAPMDLAASSEMRRNAPAFTFKRNPIQNPTMNPFEFKATPSTGTLAATAAARMLPKVTDYITESGMFGGKSSGNPIDPNYMEDIDSPYAGTNPDD